MYRRGIWREAAAPATKIFDFVDSGFLQNERPKIPGGAWSIDALKVKSMTDLQTIWYTIIKEKNKLNTMQRHYTKHQESLGAMPAPSRVEMLEKSMDNIRTVLRERHDLATERAVKIFEERKKKGMYRYPPGPHPPPEQRTSVLIITLKEKPLTDSITEFFADEAVFESHKGIVDVKISLPDEVMTEKQKAHEAFENWFNAKRAFEDYRKYNDQVSVWDNAQFEIAPGVYSSGPKAKDVPIPAPMDEREPPSDVMERLNWESRSKIEQTTIQLGHFPNITSLPPEHPGERPTHPDEISGPWQARVEFDTPKRAGNILKKMPSITEIDGVQVLSVVEEPFKNEHTYESLPFYEIVDQKEKAHQIWKQNSPLLTEWKDEYKKPLAQPLIEIIKYNYNNKIDYAEREARMMGLNLWEPPIPIDYTCGKGYQVPQWLSERDQWDADVPRFPMEFENY